MKDYITVKISKDDALDMLMNRLSEQWVSDDDIYELFEEMYQQSLDDGVFDGREFNIWTIVDNDYVNNCSIIDENDDIYDELVESIKEDEHDTSYGYIESYKELDDGSYLFLLRH